MQRVHGVSGAVYVAYEGEDTQNAFYRRGVLDAQSTQPINVALSHLLPFLSFSFTNSSVAMNAPLTYPFYYSPPAEKALATLNGTPIPGTFPAVPLRLSAFPFDQQPPPGSVPQPGASMRVVKQLPVGYTDSQLYDLFRPFGALASAHTGVQFGPNSGSVQFWREDEARRAEEELHCAEIDEGQSIAVQTYNSQRRGPGGHAPSEISPNAPPFVPGAQMFGSPVTHSPPPPHVPFQGSPRRVSGPFVHGPGQQVQFAPPTGPGSGSHSGLIDPCNLFVRVSSARLLSTMKPLLTTLL